MTVFIRRDKVDPEIFFKNTRNLFFLTKNDDFFRYYLMIIQLILAQLEGLLVWIREFRRYLSATGCRLRSSNQLLILIQFLLEMTKGSYNFSPFRVNRVIEEPKKI